MDVQTVKSKFYCDYCKQEITQYHYDFTSGYGVDKDGKKCCYTCCANWDKEDMIQHGNAMLYLDVGNQPERNKGRIYLQNWTISNWPSSLKFENVIGWTGRHNWGLRVYFARFIGPDGKVWSGRTIGDNTQIFHCYRTKLKSLYD
jgi:hypothetical protein